MTTLFTLVRKSALAVALIAGLSFTAGAASACDYYYKTITSYVAVQQPIAYCVTRYDDCGNLYQVRLISYRTVNVPVTKRVRFSY